MKAILVIDMPESCIDCKFMKHGICLAYKSERRMNDEEYYSCDEAKPSWCPLKPMPERVKENVMKGMPNEEWQQLYDEGWNDCIKEIEK